MEIIHAGEDNFNELTKNKEVLVDFYATWCGPCKMLMPELEEIKDAIQIIEIDVDTAPNLCKQFGVMSVPTLIHFKEDGQKKETIGYMPKEEILKWLGK